MSSFLYNDIDHHPKSIFYHGDGVVGVDVAVAAVVLFQQWVAMPSSVVAVLLLLLVGIP